METVMKESLRENAAEVVSSPHTWSAHPNHSFPTPCLQTLSQNSWTISFPVGIQQCRCTLTNSTDLQQLHCFWPSQGHRFWRRRPLDNTHTQHTLCWLRSQQHFRFLRACSTIPAQPLRQNTTMSYT